MLRRVGGVCAPPRCIVWNMRNVQVACVCDPGDDNGAPGEVTALLHCRRKGNWFICVGSGATFRAFRDSDDLTTLRPAVRYDASELERGGRTPTVSALALCVDACDSTGTQRNECERGGAYALGLDDGRVVLYDPDIRRRCGLLRESRAARAGRRGARRSRRRHPRPHFACGVPAAGQASLRAGVESLFVAAPSLKRRMMGAPSVMLWAGYGDGVLRGWDVPRRRVAAELQCLPKGESLSALTIDVRDPQHPLREMYIAAGDAEGNVVAWALWEPGGVGGRDAPKAAHPTHGTPPATSATGDVTTPPARRGGLRGTVCVHEWRASAGVCGTPDAGPSVPPPAAAADDRSARTRRFARYDPASLPRVDAVLAKYEGKEEQFLAALVKRHGPERACVAVAKLRDAKLKERSKLKCNRRIGEAEPQPKLGS
eukprot:gene14540-15552_t